MLKKNRIASSNLFYAADDRWDFGRWVGIWEQNMAVEPAIACLEEERNIFWRRAEWLQGGYDQTQVVVVSACLGPSRVGHVQQATAPSSSQTFFLQTLANFLNCASPATGAAHGLLLAPVLMVQLWCGCKGVPCQEVQDLQRAGLLFSVIASCFLVKVCVWVGG